MRSTIPATLIGQRPNRFFLADFVSIQRNSFLNFLEKGLIEEFSKMRSSAPLTNRSKTLEVFFYPEYYQLTKPKYSLKQAILKGKSYSSRLYIPVQLTTLLDKKTRIIQFKWAYIADLPIMTKRGHFIINGAARVIVNQIIRSPGIYYQTKVYENYITKWAQKPESVFERHYADLICQRGTWLRFEIDRDKKIWAQTKKGPKIPILWFLIAMGLTEKMIFQSVMDPQRLLYNMLEDPQTELYKSNGDFKQDIPPYIATPPEAWEAIYQLFNKKKKIDARSASKYSLDEAEIENQEKTKANQNLLYLDSEKLYLNNKQNRKSSQQNRPKIKPAGKKTGTGKQKAKASTDLPGKTYSLKNKPLSELGRQLIFNKFMNPRTYDLSKQGRLTFNKKLNLSISPYQTTLTPQDILAATDYLLKVEYGFKKVDDIDHLKNRRVRTSGELIQIQFGIGLVRFEKTIREKLASGYKNINNLPFASHKKMLPNKNKSDINVTRSAHTQPSSVVKNQKMSSFTDKSVHNKIKQKTLRTSDVSMSTFKPVPLNNTGWTSKRTQTEPFLSGNLKQNNRKTLKKSISGFLPRDIKNGVFKPEAKRFQLINSLINTKAVNSVLREFFGTSPLSQFMDQINPLAELTHKRRLSSMGPGGVTRDSATLDIRGIHPSHYGRICPVETPEGKNTGLVNSLTTYARVNSQGFIETPFYKVYKGQVQQKAGMFYLSAEHEAKMKLGAADLFASDIGFLYGSADRRRLKSKIPVRIEEEFTKISRNFVEYVGVSPTQMVSIATSLIPFLEHDDANRALMGSNMQRQAVPLLKPERPIVGTGLEARAVSDSGHALQVQKSGLVTYVSADKILIYRPKII